MEKTKKPFYKKWWFWVLVAVFFLAMGNAKPSQNKVPKEEKVEQVVEEVSSEPESAELTTKDQLAAIVEDLGIKHEDLKIVQGTPDSDRFNISYTYTATVWDETDLVSSCMTDYINICSKAYQIKDVNSIQLFVFLGMTDAKGNEVTEKGFDMCMPKETFNTFNWDRLQYQQGKYTVIESESDFLDIHPGISSKVDFDKVMYK